MHAPAVSGIEARRLLECMTAEHALEFELDRDIFEAAYGPLEYKDPFERFCRTGELSIVVVAYCQGRLWRDKL